MKSKDRHHGCRIREFTWRGHNLVAMENALLRTSIITSKGTDIFEFRHKASDVDVLWHSNRPLPDGSTYWPETAGSREVFMDWYVGGWPVSFPTGHPAGEYYGAMLTTHGEVSVQPWDYEIVEDTAELIRVICATQCRRLPFRMQREFSLRHDAARLEIRETIENLASIPMEFAWGQHPTFGPPFLTPDCRIDLPRGRYSSRKEPLPNAVPRFSAGCASNEPVLESPAGLIDLRWAPPKEGGFMDNYEVKLEGPGMFAIRNKALGFGVALQWDSKVFPYLWEWEASQACTRGLLWGRDYLLAFEPFNCALGGGLTTLHGKGALAVIAAGASQSTTITAGFCDAGHEFTGEYLKRPAPR